MKTILLIFILVISQLQDSFSQNWQWAKHIHSTGNDYAKVKCVDSQGNSYAIGTYTATQCVFDNDTISGTGSDKQFLAKYSSTGNLIWARTVASSIGTQFCTTALIDIEYDTISNSILFAGLICLPFTMGATTLSSSTGSTETIIGKVDLNGEIIWYQKINGASVVKPNKIAYDNTDNIYVICTNTSPFIMGNDTLPIGVFVLKYNSTGGQQFVKNIIKKGQYPGNISMQYPAISICKNNFFFSVVGSGSIAIDTVQYYLTGKSGKFIGNFDLNGNFIWAKLAGSLHYGNICYEHANDTDQNIYTLYTIGDSATIGNAVVHKIGLADIALVKHDSLGNFVWIKQVDFSGIANNRMSITNDKYGNIYFTGGFGGLAHFGNNTISTTNTNDMYLAKYNSNGDCIGVDNFGTAEGVAIVIDNNNNPIVSGTFVNAINIGNTSFTCNDTYDAFIAKHDAITGIPDPRRTTNNQLFIHANPNEGKCNITVPDEFAHEKNLVLSIYNSSGKLIQQKKLEMSEGKIKLNLEAEAKGLYNAVLSNGTKSYSGKIVFE